MFSSKQYAWSDINVAIKGRIINGITEIEYTKNEEKKVFTAGVLILMTLPEEITSTRAK